MKNDENGLWESFWSSRKVKDSKGFSQLIEDVGEGGSLKGPEFLLLLLLLIKNFLFFVFRNMTKLIDLQLYCVIY